MDEKAEIRAAEERLGNALERMEQALGRIEAQYEALSVKVDRISARIEETKTPEQTSRKTLSAAVTTLLAKNGLQPEAVESASLIKALASLSVEQRIAVKAELARAGVIE